MEPVVVLITTLPDAASARTLAEALVRERLAACVNLMAGCTSTVPGSTIAAENLKACSGGSRSSSAQARPAAIARTIVNTVRTVDR
jgi:hypothetical protein